MGAENLASTGIRSPGSIFVYYHKFLTSFLGAFEKLREADISLSVCLCPSMRLSVRMELSATTGRIFTKFDTWEFFEKSL